MQITKLDATNTELNLTVQRAEGERVSVLIDGVSLKIDGWTEPEIVAMNAKGGRVNVFPGKLSNPSQGRVVQRADGKSTLFLNDVPGPAEITVDMDGNRRGVIAVSPQLQAKGWGERNGEFYMLETGTNGVIVEPGRKHRKIYVSPNGLTAAQIAADAKLDPAKITAAWLVKNPKWGATPETALSVNLGCNLWGLLTQHSKAWPNSLKRTDPCSVWMMLERGHEYAPKWESHNGWFARSMAGESPLHPHLITAYGEGAMPVISQVSSQHGVKNIVLKDLRLRDGLNDPHVFPSDCILLDGVEWGDGESELNLSGGGLTTIYRCGGNDVYRPESKSGDTWQASENRISAIYSGKSNGLLIWESGFDKAGWVEGYSTTELAVTAGPMPGSYYSHNLYLSSNLNNVHIEGVLCTSAASMGIQMRSGGRIVDCVMIDNNIAGNDMGGNSISDGYTTFIGEYGLHIGNVVTEVGDRKYPMLTGGRNWGFMTTGRDISIVDCIAVHYDDPANPKGKNRPGDAGYKTGTSVHFDNQINFRWSDKDLNVEGLDTKALMGTTIQNYAGKAFRDLMDEIKALERDNVIHETYRILDYFRKPVMPKLERNYTAQTGPEVAIFLPDDRGEGFRWDLDLNWSNGRVPGLKFSDRVDLDGNHVLFGRHTATVGELVCSTGSRLEVSSGKLMVEKVIGEAATGVSGSGQLFLPEGRFRHAASGGRTVFMGPAEAFLSVGGDAECILGALTTIPKGSVMVLIGSQHFTGWEREGNARLVIDGTLEFRADMDGRAVGLRRFRRNADEPEPTIEVEVILRGSVIAPGVQPGTVLTGPGIKVIDEGATFGPGLKVDGGALVMGA